MAQDQTEPTDSAACSTILTQRVWGYDTRIIIGCCFVDESLHELCHIGDDGVCQVADKVSPFQLHLLGKVVRVSSLRSGELYRGKVVQYDFPVFQVER